MIRREDFLAAYGEPDEGFSGALDAALRQVRAEEARPVMKKKLSIGLLAAIIAILTLTGAALAVGLNLFGIFARYDERLARVAEQSELVTEIPGEVETEKTGKSAVEIVNAYYDGESLLVAYIAEDVKTFEPFTPTAEELARMEIMDDPWATGELFEFGPLDPVQQAFNDALKSGEPFGFAEYSVFASDQMFVGEGNTIELIPNVGNETTLEDGRKAYLMEYATPLPEGARNRDELELHLPILRFEYREWFDGKDIYILNGPLNSDVQTYEWIDGKTHTSYARGPEKIGEAVAMVKRTLAETRAYVGEGSYNGVPVRVEATMSAIRGEVKITADGEAFADAPAAPGDGQWYDLELMDENGARLGLDRVSFDSRNLYADFSGNGFVPKQLRLYIAVDEGGSANEESVGTRSEPIVLMPKR